MPRKPRIEYPGAFYHVFNRGNRRERIYLSDVDYKGFEKMLLKVTEWSGVNLYAWCLMPNHFHLLVETPDGNLSQFMRRLLTGYARYFNVQHKYVGHVFQGRYKALVCDKESYLLELIRYIHLNPVRARIVSHPEDFAWSSYRSRFNDQQDNLLDHLTVLEYFGNDTQARREAYRQFTESATGKPEEWPHDVLQKNTYLGSPEFIERIRIKRI